MHDACVVAILPPTEQASPVCSSGMLLLLLRRFSLSASSTWLEYSDEWPSFPHCVRWSPNQSMEAYVRRRDVNKRTIFLLLWNIVIVVVVVVVALAPVLDAIVVSIIVCTTTQKVMVRTSSHCRCRAAGGRGWRGRGWRSCSGRRVGSIIGHHRIAQRDSLGIGIALNRHVRHGRYKVDGGVALNELRAPFGHARFRHDPHGQGYVVADGCQAMQRRRRCLSSLLLRSGRTCVPGCQSTGKDCRGFVGDLAIVRQGHTRRFRLTAARRRSSRANQQDAHVHKVIAGYRHGRMWGCRRTAAGHIKDCGFIRLQLIE